jgi:predicted AlkP superfamily phosphohydrolase/phosphomutase
LLENDRGPDDAEHDWHGVLLIHDPEETIGKSLKGRIRIEDVYQKIFRDYILLNSLYTWKISCFCIL